MENIFVSDKVKDENMARDEQASAPPEAEVVPASETRALMPPPVVAAATKESSGEFEPANQHMVALKPKFLPNLKSLMFPKMVYEQTKRLVITPLLTYNHDPVAALKLRGARCASFELPVDMFPRGAPIWKITFLPEELLPIGFDAGGVFGTGVLARKYYPTDLLSAEHKGQTPPLFIGHRSSNYILPKGVLAPAQTQTKGNGKGQRGQVQAPPKRIQPLTPAPPPSPAFKRSILKPSAAVSAEMNRRLALHHISVIEMVIMPAFRKPPSRYPMAVPMQMQYNMYAPDLSKVIFAMQEIDQITVAIISTVHQPNVPEVALSTMGNEVCPKFELPVDIFPADTNRMGPRFLPVRFLPDFCDAGCVFPPGSLPDSVFHGALRAHFDLEQHHYSMTPPLFVGRRKQPQQGADGKLQDHKIDSIAMQLKKLALRNMAATKKSNANTSVPIPESTKRSNEFKMSVAAGRPKGFVLIESDRVPRGAIRTDFFGAFLMGCFFKIVPNVKCIFEDLYNNSEEDDEELERKFCQGHPKTVLKADKASQAGEMDSGKIQVKDAQVEAKEAEKAEVEVKKAEKAEVEAKKAEKAEVEAKEAKKAEDVAKEAEKAEVEAKKAEKAEVEAKKAEKAEGGVTEVEEREIVERKVEEREVEETKDKKTEVALPKAEEAEVEKPEAAKDEIEKPETVKAEVEKAEAAKPEVKKPEASRAEVEKPEEAKAEVEKPEAAKAEAEKPEAAKAEVKKPEAAKAEVQKAEAAKAKVEKPEAAKAEVKKPEEAKAEAEKPEVAKAEVKKPEEAKAEAEKPEAAKADVEEPESEESEVEIEADAEPDSEDYTTEEYIAEHEPDSEDYTTEEYIAEHEPDSEDYTTEEYIAEECECGECDSEEYEAEEVESGEYEAEGEDEGEDEGDDEAESVELVECKDYDSDEWETDELEHDEEKTEKKNKADKCETKKAEAVKPQKDDSKIAQPLAKKSNLSGSHTDDENTDSTQPECAGCAKIYSYFTVDSNLDDIAEAAGDLDTAHFEVIVHPSELPGIDVDRAVEQFRQVLQCRNEIRAKMTGMISAHVAKMEADHKPMLASVAPAETAAKRVYRKPCSHCGKHH